MNQDKNICENCGHSISEHIVDGFGACTRLSNFMDGDCNCPYFRPASSPKEKICEAIIHAGWAWCAEKKPCKFHPETGSPSSRHRIDRVLNPDRYMTSSPQKVLWCDGGKECRCICHQTDYPLPKDFPRPERKKIEPLRAMTVMYNNFGDACLKVNEIIEWIRNHEEN